ncbi:hypothetical protein AB5J62_19235 [Amycolatopsis sp. cg5]|uniref:hypothetical protein n=1 Tax=Amycolatopsis sp. cg5 TaxID=3238802 RepID=UPI00352531AE
MPLGGSSKEALVVGAAFMTGLGSLFPVRLNLTGEELEFVFVLPDDRADEHPFVELKKRIRARYALDTDSPPPRFFVDTGGRWARLRVELAGTAVRALIVMPEEVTAQSLNAPELGRWQEQVSCAVQVAVEEIARMLSRCHHQTGGGAPLVDLALHYVPDRGYETRSAEAHKSIREFIAPVKPTFKMRWRSVTFAQRRALIAELADVTSTGRWPRRRLVTRTMGLALELPSWTTPGARTVPVDVDHLRA